ncbi:TRAP transporter small permease [Sporosarcina sp. P3]|uniref:TRAP transporter small permease subunit n=1 Tax=Sporosarcina TaxID=1569 RepID=UPI0009DC52D8|nr:MULTISPECIES: TRAP transporter small permease [Sporosarcina]ARF17800.1 hypothetical protein SporoP17a_11280 [Sporosarcina ureae]PID20179.1 TRAP transporter small permease [Sporosarcina sp. P3]
MTNKKKSLSFYDKVTRFSEFGAYVGGCLILLAGFLITYQVAIRYFFKLPTTWELELASYLLIAATFFASSSALHHNAHVNLDIITSSIKEKPRDLLYIIMGILGLIFSIVMVERGVQLWLEAYHQNWRSGTSWNPKLIYPYLIIPIGMTWFAIQYYVEIYRKIRSLSSKDPE